MFDDINNRTQMIADVKELVNTKVRIGRELAEATKRYKVAYTKTCAIMILKGWEFEVGVTKPVAQTAAITLALGVPEVAELRAIRDAKQVVYDANQEAIYVQKKEIDIIEADINATRNNRG